MKSRLDLPDETVKMFGKDWNIGHLLANELAAPRYKMDNNGAIQIESKMDMKARGLKSTNIADALCMSEYFNSIAYQLWGPKQQARKQAAAGSQNPGPSRDGPTDNPYAWMTA